MGRWMAEGIHHSCRVFQKKGEEVQLLLMRDEVVQRVVGVQRDTMGDVQEVLIPSRMVVVVVLVAAAVADIPKGHHSRLLKEGEEEPQRYCHAVEDAETAGPTVDEV